MSVKLKLDSPMKLVENLELLSSKMTGSNFSKIERQDMQLGLDGFRGSIIKGVKSNKYTAVECDAMISAMTKAQNILDGKKPDFDNTDLFIKRVEPKTSLKTRQFLLESSSQGTSFPREKFTTADHAYLRLTGSYYTESENRPYRFVEQNGNIYENPVNPEFLAYGFFDQVREIYENPDQPVALDELRETLNSLDQISPKNVYPVLYWAYREAKHANAQPDLIHFLERRMIRAEFQPEFQSSESREAFIKEAFGMLPADLKLVEGEEPYWTVFRLFTALCEDRFEDLKCQFIELEELYPESVEAVRNVCLEMLDNDAIDIRVAFLKKS